MRNKRMFSLDVVDTDAFLELSISAQALYFHLGMRADDDGFISSPKKITSMVNCGTDDLKLLIAKGYLIPFNSGVVVIRHWKQNNFIRKDRYIATKSVNEYNLLDSENGIYSIIIDRGVPSCNHVVDERLTEKRIEENSIDNIYSSPGGEQKNHSDQMKEDFEKIYAVYPKKRGRTKAFEKYKLWIKGKVVDGKRVKLTREQIYIAVRSYVETMKADGTEIEYYKNFDTFMGIQILDFIPEEDADG